jgi:hypothetical protein
MMRIWFLGTGTAFACPRFRRNAGFRMFDAIWKMVVWADEAMEANALPAILAFISSAVITSILRSILDAL